MPATPFPFPELHETPFWLWEVDGHCGPMAAWLVLRYFGKRTNRTRLLRGCRYSTQEGLTYTIGLALGLKAHGLEVAFYSGSDDSTGPYEEQLYQLAARWGIHPRPALSMAELLQKTGPDCVPIVLYELEGEGHFSPLLGCCGNQLLLPLAPEPLTADQFEECWSRPGIARQVLLVSRSE